jgi:hypothetical protein
LSVHAHEKELKKKGFVSQEKLAEMAGLNRNYVGFWKPEGSTPSSE